MRGTGTCASLIARRVKVPRDLVFVPNWFTTCEVFPELPSIQGWVEAMMSLGRLIFFDQPGSGSVRSVDAGRAADVGAVGRQHHRGVRRSRESRSGTRRGRRRVHTSGAVRGDISVPHNRAGRARGLCGFGGRTHGGTHPRNRALP